MQAPSRRCWRHKCSGSMAANLKSSPAQRRRASRPAPHRAQAARRRLRRPTCLRHRPSLRRRRRHRPRPRLDAGASPRGPNDVLARTSRLFSGLSLCGGQSAKKIFIVPDGAIQGVLSSGKPSRVGAQPFCLPRSGCVLGLMGSRVVIVALASGFSPAWAQPSTGSHQRGLRPTRPQPAAETSSATAAPPAGSQVCLLACPLSGSAVCGCSCCFGAGSAVCSCLSG